MTRPRVLVLRALGLGDFLTAVPALRALQAALGDHDLVLAAPEELRPLVALAGAGRLLPTGELAPIPWVGSRPEVAVDLHGNGPATKALLLALRPRRLVAFGGPRPDGRWHAGPTWRADEHEVERWCRLVTESFGAAAVPGDHLLRAPAPLHRPPGRDWRRVVVVHPGAAAASRRWPARRFAAVVEQLTGLGHRVVLTGSPAEKDLAQMVARTAGLPEDSVLAGRTDLDELSRLVAHAALVVSGDTGTAHLASAFGTPSVLLFGPMPPRLWGPPAGPHTVLWHGTGRGDPHGRVADPALLRITVDEVVRACVLRLAPTTADAAATR